MRGEAKVLFGISEEGYPRKFTAPTRGYVQHAWGSRDKLAWMGKGVCITRSAANVGWVGMGGGGPILCRYPEEVFSKMNWGGGGSGAGRS